MMEGRPVTLEDLLSEAGRRSLSGDELEELARLASESGSVPDAVGRLMSSGPRGALNLRMASKLRELHSERTSSLPLASRQRRGAVVETRSGPPISFSTHAVEQYMLRVRPDLTFDEAAVALASEAESASKMRARTASGQEQWACRSGAILVIKRDGPGLPAACVTVLTQDMKYIRR